MIAVRDQFLASDGDIFVVQLGYGRLAKRMNRRKAKAVQRPSTFQGMHGRGNKTKPFHYKILDWQAEKCRTFTLRLKPQPSNTQFYFLPSMRIFSNSSFMRFNSSWPIFKSLSTVSSMTLPPALITEAISGRVRDSG